MISGGMVRYHLRQDGQLTIYEILASRAGAGVELLNWLIAQNNAKSIVAKCPHQLPANGWYKNRGFTLEYTERTPAGSLLNVWRMSLEPPPRIVNVGRYDIELICCHGGGNQRMQEIIIRSGLLFGARMPDHSFYKPYFIDQNWRQPNRERYIQAARTHRPRMATVLDIERPEQLEEALGWADDIAPYVGVIVIIPKVPGITADLPRTIGSCEIRLGYPLGRCEGEVRMADCINWPVHLLGGNPYRQIDFVQKEQLHVRSVDTNMHAKLALRGLTMLPGGGTYSMAPAVAMVMANAVIMAEWIKPLSPQKRNKDINAHRQLEMDF